MLDGLIEKKLENSVDNDVLVIMDDDFAFLGELVEFDNETMVLKRVLQAPNKDINWKKISKASEELKKGEKGKKRVGFMNWNRVNLEEVYIRLEHVTRIWPWIPKHEEKSKEGKRPIYYEKEYM